MPTLFQLRTWNQHGNTRHDERNTWTWTRDTRNLTVENENEQKSQINNDQTKKDNEKEIKVDPKNKFPWSNPQKTQHLLKYYPFWALCDHF